MNKLMRDIEVGEILVGLDGKLYKAHAGNGMKHSNMGGTIFAVPVNENGEPIGSIVRVNEIGIDGAATRIWQDANGKFKINLTPPNSVPEREDSVFKQVHSDLDVEDHDLERALSHAVSDATTDVMSEDRVIEILIECMDVESQRKALQRIVDEMDEPNEDDDRFFPKEEGQE